MEKFKNVKDLILNHMFWTENNSMSISARLFRDADTLDFLGATGILRRASLVAVKSTNQLAETVERLEIAHQSTTDKLSTKSAKKLAKKKIDLFNIFMKSIERETIGKSAI